MVPEALGPVVRPPTLDEERRLWRAGFDLVAGVDEVGRGQDRSASEWPLFRPGPPSARSQESFEIPSWCPSGEGNRCSTRSRRGARTGRSGTPPLANAIASA